LPAPPRTYLADAVSGLMAAFAIAAALHRRAATGRGGQVDLSMQESLFSLLAVSHGTLGESDLSAGAATEAWSRRPAYDIYRAADGRYLAVAAAREASCRALFEHLGRGELADEAMRPGDGAGAAAEFLRQALGGKPAAAWQAELAALDIEVAVVNSPAEAFELPQLQSRGMVVESEHPQAGRLRQIGVPGVGPDGDGLGPAPAIGADTEAVLRELDYDEAAIARLREDGAI
ncbi:MAG: CoA transferase, partial [Alphaproteobacteria bacterium]|nr:CoA transferase [Alphaproteobacteria bacterium]